MRERLWAGLGSAVFVLLFGYLMFIGLGVEMPAIRDKPLVLLGLEPPPATPKPEPRPVPIATKHSSSSPSPRNLRRMPTEIVSPPPLVPPVLPPPVVSAPVAGHGAASASGAALPPGPGEGAGGEGNGRGDGSGDGDDGGGVPPRFLKGKLRFAELPANLREGGVGGSVGVRYSVETDGSVGDCTVTGSSGNAELDKATCDLIRLRFRYAPSRDPDGRAVRSIIVENHSWIVDTNTASPPRP